MPSNHTLYRLPTLGALTLGLGLFLPIMAWGATVHYNNFLSFDTYNNYHFVGSSPDPIVTTYHHPTTLSINFAYNTEDRSFSDVNSLFNDGGTPFPVNGRTFPADFAFFNEAGEFSPTNPNILHATFNSTNRDLVRYTYSTDFLVGSNILDPLALAHTSLDEQYPAFTYCALTCTTAFADEKLTNLDLSTAPVPLPPALILFASSLLGLRFMRKKSIY